MATSTILEKGAPVISPDEPRFVLWGVGTFDSGLGLYVRPSILKRAGIRLPRGPRDAWTAEELTGILRRLRQAPDLEDAR